MPCAESVVEIPQRGYWFLSLSAFRYIIFRCGRLLDVVSGSCMELARVRTQSSVTTPTTFVLLLDVVIGATRALYIAGACTGFGNVSPFCVGVVLIFNRVFRSRCKDRSFIVSQVLFCT